MSSRSNALLAVFALSGIGVFSSVESWPGDGIQQVEYTTAVGEDCPKLLGIMQPYVTMLEAVLEQYFKTDADAAILFKLLGTLGRHVIVRNDAAEVRPALVKESVSFMREYAKFAQWLAENYKDRSLIPIAYIMDKIFAARFGRRLKTIETEMKKLGKGHSWNELMRFWQTVNGTDTEKLFSMSHNQLKSLDKFLDKTKTMALEHRSFELLYQTQVLEALADLARSMTTRRQRNTGMVGPKYYKPILVPVSTSSSGSSKVSTVAPTKSTEGELPTSNTEDSSSTERKSGKSSKEEKESKASTKSSSSSSSEVRTKSSKESEEPKSKEVEDSKKASKEASDRASRKEDEEESRSDKKKKGAKSANSSSSSSKENKEGKKKEKAPKSNTKKRGDSDPIEEPDKVEGSDRK